MTIMMDKCKIICLIISVFIVASDYPLKSEAYRFYTIKNVKNALAFENEMVQLECTSDLPLEYCKFRHEENPLQIDILLEDNKCSFNISATNTTAGMWKCYLGRKGYEEEIVKEMRLRIEDELAATEREVAIVDDQPVTLLCVTTNVMEFRNCFFKPPENRPEFAISSEDKRENPILDRYYYPPNKSFKNGECAVTIITASEDDFGIWKCSVLYENGHEHKDFITVINKDYNIPTSVSIIIAILGVGVSIYIGGVAWEFLARRKRTRGEPELVSMQELQAMQEVQERQEQPHDERPKSALEPESDFQDSEE